MGGLSVRSVMGCSGLPFPTLIIGFAILTGFLLLTLCHGCRPMRKLWLDDVRLSPDMVDWETVRTAEDAISRLQTTHYDMISLDHDLGEGHTSGYAVAAYIEFVAHSDLKRSLHPELPNSIFIHSQNPVGVRNIAAALIGAGYKELVKNEYYERGR